MMIEPAWWIRDIDWRLSSGIIFFIQLVVWRNPRKRQFYPARIAGSCLALCGGSWVLRYVIEEWLKGRLAVSVGYTVYIMALSLLFILCYHFCYHVTEDVLLFVGVIALTLWRMCWDAVKLASAIPIGTGSPWTEGSPIQSFMSYILYILISIWCYEGFWYFIKRPPKYPKKIVSCLFVVVLLSQMLLEFSYQMLYSVNGDNGVLYFLSAFLYSLLIFVLLIIISFLTLVQEENVSMQNFIHSKQQYYEISREGILSLQIKCHDLKHQIALIRSAEGQRQLEKYMDNLSDSIDEYNTVVDSGNQNLDVVLTEKNIICSTNGIRFTYIIDGKLFNFLTDMEIYALFGNAMDNALEGMADVSCPEKKFISLKAAKRDDMVVLTVENYFEHSLKFQDGMPMTTKAEESHHGFGLRSIMLIAQDHHGSASVSARDNIFKLTVSMRPPKETQMA